MQRGVIGMSAGSIAHEPQAGTCHEEPPGLVEFSDDAVEVNGEVRDHLRVGRGCGGRVGNPGHVRPRDLRGEGLGLAEQQQRLIEFARGGGGMSMSENVGEAERVIERE